VPAGQPAWAQRAVAVSQPGEVVVRVERPHILESSQMRCGSFNRAGLAFSFSGRLLISRDAA